VLEIFIIVRWQQIWDC